jgi:hypothetical protein
VNKHIPLWKLALWVWPVCFGLVTGFETFLGHYLGDAEKVDWLLVGVVSSALAAVVIMIVERVQARPSPEQRAALSAIFRAGPGTIGAVVVTRHGVPEVIATVKSKEEYLQLVGSGQLPPDHHVYLPSDV